MLRRATVIYRGMVQGVGFRYTARGAASRYQVQGYVKNITDGTVEVVADIEQQMREFIRSRTVAWGEATGEFKGFGVRF